MKTINYIRCNNLIHITLDNMYSGDPNTIRILDQNLTNIIEVDNKQLVHVIAWYDNEMGYSAQMVRTAEYLGRK